NRSRPIMSAEFQTDTSTGSLINLFGNGFRALALMVNFCAQGDPVPDIASTIFSQRIVRTIPSNETVTIESGLTQANCSRNLLSANRNQSRCTSQRGRAS